MHTINIHSSTFNNTLYSIQKRLVLLLCIVSALVSASLWSMTASAAAPVALSLSASEQSFALTVTQVDNSPPVVAPSLRILRTYAGSGVNDFADGSALTAQFNTPSGIARTTDGRLFIADTNNHRIRVISADGATVSTYAGDGVEGFADGSTSTARFNFPRGIAVTADGRLFIADVSNSRISVISADGATVSTYASIGFGFADGSTSTARFRLPRGVALAADGRVFVADELNSRIRVISADGATVSTYAGSGIFGLANGSTSTARFNTPRGVAVAADGRVFVADAFNHRIRVISADGATVSTYAGDGVQSFADGSTTTAQFDSPTDVVVASDGRVFVADTGNNRIRVISADGAFVSTYAGSGTATQTNEPQALQAALDIDLGTPQRMTLAPDGRLFFTDSDSHRIHVIEVISSTSENFGSVSLGAEFQGAGTRVINAQNLFLDAEANDLTFSILSGNEDGLFAIDAASGRVTLAGSLTDRQTGINTLVIQAQDLAGSATVTLTIVVEEVNDPPTFALSSSTLELDEDFGTNTDIVVVNPDDGDAAIEQILTYSVSTNNVGFTTLTINAQSGTLTLTSIADAFGEATLTITVTDSSATNNEATQTLRLRVLPVNDPPAFSLSTTTLRLDEDFAQAITVSVVNPNDGDDDGMEQTLTYSISPVSLGVVGISFDANSGQVILNSVADENSINPILFEITANDGGAVNNLFSQSFTLEIEPVDDPGNDPPNVVLSTAVLTLDEDFGSASITVVSSDDGDGTNQPLTYSISTTNIGFATISIDSNSGAISLSSVDNQFGQATLFVTVDDSAPEDNLSIIQVVVEARAVNDVPTFTLSRTALTLNEDFGSNTDISVVSPNDGDNGDQVITYSINPTNTEFATLAIDAQTGEVTITSVANGFGSAVITVIAEDDGGGDTNQSTQTFMLTVVDSVSEAASSGGGGGGCSLQSESGAIDWTLWLLALLSLAALRGYRRRVS